MSQVLNRTGADAHGDLTTARRCLLQVDGLISSQIVWNNCSDPGSY